MSPAGSVCNNSFRQCYVLPVMDSIFVRKAYRGKGYGLQMLEDFVDSFNEDELGLKYPLSPVMINGWFCFYLNSFSIYILSCLLLILGF